MFNLFQALSWPKYACDVVGVILKEAKLYASEGKYVAIFRIYRRQRICGKVMFSQMFFSSQGYLWSHVLSVAVSILVPGPFQGVGMSRRVDATGYGRHAGGTHPTGMLSCCPDIFGCDVIAGKNIESLLAYKNLEICPHFAVECSKYL